MVVAASLLTGAVLGWMAGPAVGTGGGMLLLLLGLVATVLRRNQRDLREMEGEAPGDDGPRPPA